jgi:hypothetical protein
MTRFPGSRNLRRAAALCALPVLLLVSRCDDPGVPQDFAVTVKIFTHGTLCLWTYEVTPSAVKVTRHPTGGDPGDTVLDRTLSGGERRRLGRLLAGFPLDSLQERYANSVVTGNRSYTFDIRSGGREKHVSVYYEPQRDLVILAGAIDELLPARFRIGYR